MQAETPDKLSVRRRAALRANAAVGPIPEKRSRYWSYAIWGLWALLFFVLELPGLFRRNQDGPFASTPWVTLSETVWDLESRFHPLKILLGAATLDVLVHLLTGTALWPPFTPQ